MKRLKARKKILERYMRRNDGKVVIDISVDKIEELFQNYDKSAPYIKKDLDPDLGEYIVNSTEEIRDMPFVLQFQIKSLADREKMTRVRQSVKNYFEYLEALEVRHLYAMRRTSIIHFSIGVFFVIIFAIVSPENEEKLSIFQHIITEGLIVAAWVSLWSAIDTFIINWTPHKRKIKLYQRIRSCEIIFNQA